MHDDATADNLDGLVGEFVVEAREGLDQLDLDLLALERDPGSTDLLSGAFRTLHTIKGSSGFLGFVTLEAVTHAGENLLGGLRDGDIALSPDLVTVLLEVGDATRLLVDEIERTGSEGDLDPTDLVARVVRCRKAAGPPVAPAAPEPPGPLPPAAQRPQDGDPAAQAPLLGDLLLVRGVVTSEVLGRALALQKGGDARPLGVILVDLGVPVEQVDATVRHQQEMKASLLEGTVRVDVTLLDTLMGLGAGMGPLIRDLHASVRRDAPQLEGALLALERQANEVSTGIVRARLQPVHAVWSRLPRLVRDLCVQVGKSVDLATVGGATEIDRTVLEAVRDPLTHLVRNSIDHGIEAPDVRLALGKPAAGALEVRAYLDRSEVVIEISDDGRGIDPDRIRRKAVASGLRTRAQVARLSDAEVVDLVFEPGLSTSESITNVSGRGVGMDVVRTSVERLGGRVELLSARGSGTTVRLRTPLTVAVVPARIVCVGDHRYALPASVDSPRGATRVDLRAVLGLPAGATAGALVVLRVGADLVEVVVDEALGCEDLVVKPLAPDAASPLLIGSATCGDGSSVLVVDPVILATAPYGEGRDVARHEPGDREAVPHSEGPNLQRGADAPEGGLVERLRGAVVEVWSAYGLAGEAEPFVWTSTDGRWLPPRTPTVRAWVSLGPTVRVVLEMPSLAAHHLAARMLEVDQVSEPDLADALGELVNMLGGTMRDAVPERGQLGLPVVEMITSGRGVPPGVTAATGFSLAGQPVRVSVSSVPAHDEQNDHHSEGEAPMRVLIVDDSRVMRQIVMRTLRQAGYTGHEILEAGDGREALEQVRAQRPDLILSDWNMPVMDGLDFLQTLRSDGTTTPFGFVTSEVSASMAALAEESGADFVITKPFTVETFQESLDAVLS